MAEITLDTEPLTALRHWQRLGQLEPLAQALSEHPEWAFLEHPEWLPTLALCQLLIGQQKEAADCLERLEGQQPQDPEALADLGLALAMLGQPDQGLATLEALLAAPNPPTIAYQRLGSLYIGFGELEKAAEALAESLKREPERAEIISNLGGLEFRRGNLSEALQLYNRALQLKPELATSPLGEQRNRVLAGLGRLDELIEEKQQQLAADPSQPSHHLQLANAYRQAERIDDTESTLEAALDRFPEERMVRLALVQFCMEQKRWGQIGGRLKEWSEAEPDDLHYRLLLNQVRIEAGFLDAACEDLEAIADEAEGLPLYTHLRAQILVNEARAEEARELLEDACARFPGDLQLQLQLAEVLTSLGELEAAEAIHEQLGQVNPMQLARRIEAAGCQASPEDTEALRELSENPQLPVEAQAAASFTLARTYEKQKNYSASFEAALRANELLRPSLGYDWRFHRHQSEALIQAFTPELVRRLQGQGHPSRRPIFVTGMPRSGTTLTEQILCSHPRVYGAGELPWMTRISSLVPKVIPGSQYPAAMAQFQPEHLVGAAEYYLGKIAAQNSEAEHVVDKMPHNFDHIGLIALAFPNVPIIHLKREDRDVALSNFYQNFGAAHGLMGFAYSLEDIGHMLNDHRRLMEHWHSLFPSRIFELDYQQLVNDPEPTIRALLEHCGLPWDPQVLRFYETKRPVRTASIRQVREGIYTSSADKWRRYSEYLGPLEAVLAEGYKPLDEHRRDELGAAVFAAGPTY